MDEGYDNRRGAVPVSRAAVDQPAWRVPGTARSEWTPPAKGRGRTCVPDAPCVLRTRGGPNESAGAGRQELALAGQVGRAHQTGLAAELGGQHLGVRAPLAAHQPA